MESVDLDQELASPKRRAYAEIDGSEVMVSNGGDSDGSLTEAKGNVAPTEKGQPPVDSDSDC